MPLRELKIGTSWVRGVVGNGLTPELIVDFACAFGTWAGGGPVVIGRDTRRSSTMARAAAIAGLLSQGCEVIDLGLSSTPLVSFAVRELGAAGGLSITGSHNDARWNALKFIGADGALLNAVKSEELLDIYHASAFTGSPGDRPQRVSEAPRIADRYLEHLLSAIDLDAVRGRGLRIAVDFTNGACAPLFARLLAALDCGLVPLNEEPSSRFAHSPVPTPANMGELARTVARERLALGAAVNVDGDRIALVAAGGTPLSEEYTLPLAAENRLRRRPGPVATNLSTSRLVDVVAERHGQRVLRAAVGEGYVVDCGLEEEAVLAGEGNGGIAALPFSMTFDAALTLAMVLETLAETGCGPGELARGLPRFAMRKGEVPCSPDEVYALLERISAAFAGSVTDASDGLRAEWSDAWLHVRASNTEPLLRVIAEAESEERAESLFSEAMDLARRHAGRREV